MQFHPEVCTPPHGTEVLKNFLYNVAEAPPAWTPAAVIEEQVERIRAQVGRERVLCALSGGVDSAVAALLVHKAVGDQLTCVFVDHGLLRAERGRAGRRDIRRPLPRAARARRGAGAVPVAARGRRRSGGRSGRSSARSSSASSRKRRASSATCRFLVQGTLYSDVIESGGTEDGVAATIKSHHNVGGLPGGHAHAARRAAAAALQGRGAPRRRGARHARADGLAAAVPRPGARDPDHRRGHRASASRSCARADAILQEEIRRAGLYRELWQSFAVLPAIRSVGVQGDERTYAYPIVIRAVTSDDAMTADWARLPYDLLETISSRIINEIPGVNRVALDLTSKPPATIEWE